MTPNTAVFVIHHTGEGAINPKQTISGEGLDILEKEFSEFVMAWLLDRVSVGAGVHHMRVTVQLAEEEP